MDDDYYVDAENMSPEMLKKKWSRGYLYILDYGDGKQFKIGITKNDPSIRQNQIKRHAGMLLPNPLDSKIVVTIEVETNPYYLEQLLHMQFSHKHVTGEWFRLDDVELADIVDQIKGFGELEYFDRWYEFYEDKLPEIIANVLPANLDYFKDARLYAYYDRFVVSKPHKAKDGDQIERLQKQFDEAQRKYPDTFGDKELIISGRDILANN